MPVEKVADLKAALNVLDPKRALETKEEIEHYFVQRAKSPLQKMRMLLEDSTAPQKILFTGHRGSGKSTELAKLRLDIAESFFVVHFSAENILNLFDLTYVDVVLALALELARRASEQGVEVARNVQEFVFDFAKDITKEVGMDIGLHPELGAEFNLHIVKFVSKLRTEDVTREAVRTKVRHRISDLLETIAYLTKEIQRTTNRRVLAVVEDLDKADLAIIKSLFYEHATALLAPEVSVIYTFPIALRHDNDCMQIRSSFSQMYILPNINVCERDGSSNEEGRKRLVQVLTKRIDQGLFADETLDWLAMMSGGIPRELVVLAGMACLEARVAGKARIDLECVVRAAESRRLDYEVLLRSKQLKLLKTVRRNKAVENDEPHRELLHNLSIFEYANGDVWYDVNPVIGPLLD